MVMLIHDHICHSLRLWRVGEPNNSGGNEDEDCVVFARSTPPNPQYVINGVHPTLQVWNDVPCSRSMPFICEQKQLWQVWYKSVKSALIAKIFEWNLLSHWKSWNDIVMVLSISLCCQSTFSPRFKGQSHHSNGMDISRYIIMDVISTVGSWSHVRTFCTCRIRFSQS